MLFGVVVFFSRLLIGTVAVWSITASGSLTAHLFRRNCFYLEHIFTLEFARRCNHTATVVGHCGYNAAEMQLAAKS